MKVYQARIFAALLIIASITLAASWEFYFDDRFNSGVVIVTTHDLTKGHIVKYSDLSPVRVKNNIIPTGSINDINSVVNKETVVSLNKGMIAVSSFFDSADIVTDTKKMIVPVPNQWIYSLPGSLRRKDKVTIYEFGANKNVQAEEPLFENISVAYAKDSANQEVKASNNKMQRIDATGNISQLELVMTAKQFKIMESKAAEGKKFIFTYR